MSTTGVDPYASADVWVPSGGGWLREGEHVVNIDDVEDETAASGNPGAKFYLSNSEGKTEFRCWYGIGRDGGPFLNKIVAVFDAAGVNRPVEGEYNPNDRYRIKVEVLKRLVGKQIGVVIKPEPDQNDPSKTWDRVQGAVPTSRIDGGADTRGLPANGGGQTVPGHQDPTIPF